MKFKIESKFSPSGSQPQAIKKLTEGVVSGKKDQVLLGVTGSGKTFTIANVIANTQRPTLVIAHNKTLAAQLTQEFRQFFPQNAVGYFVSYYDYYQPEAYLPNTDTYIEKEATINEEVDRLRNAATQSILSRNDVIVIASVSCIYGLGSPELYRKSVIYLEKNQRITREELLQKLISQQFIRSEVELKRGTFRARGQTVEIMPSDREVIYQVKFDEEKILSLFVLDKINRDVQESLQTLTVFPAKHYVLPPETVESALIQIEKDLEKQLEIFRKQGRILEAERLSRRTRYDLEMIREVGYCNGIENYSRYFENRTSGSAPYTLIDYFRESFGDEFLLVIDESHVTVSQIGAMYEGDKSRKNTLIDFGFRLPSARDNRPLKFPEFEKKISQTIYTSATPGSFELEKAGGDVVEQIVRPTGLVDPETIIVETKGQIEHLIAEIEKRIKNKERTLVTTLTKKMAEDLTEYLEEKDIKVKYLHSDVETLQRITILKELREGKFDVLIGVNLLREGLDLPEVSLVAILDADKEGFLRSETSLIQTIGRAARNINGKVILYADHITGSMQRALSETKRRRKIQVAYNKEHNITPKTIEKEIKSIVAEVKEVNFDSVERAMSEKDLRQLIEQKEIEMKQAAEEMRFEEAAIVRDQLISLKKAGRFLSKIR